MPTQNSKLKTQNSLKGVLFDLGSTLQEYKHEDWLAIVNALNTDLYTYMASRGHADRLPPLDAFLELVNANMQTRRAQAATTLRGFSMLDMLGSIFAEHGIDELDTHAYLNIWYKHLEDIVYVRPDVEPTLRLLKEHGLKLGLVSNTTWPASIHDPDLARLGIKDLLDCRLYSCEVGWEKPAPPIFLAALHCLALHPEETAFVGDFLRYDVAGAQSVGMKGIWKRVEARPDDLDDHTVIPDATITTISELPDALRNLYNFPN